MAAVEILKYPISSPADITPLSWLKQAGYDASDILAVVGKTEGNGCVNDFSRTLASAVWEPRIPDDAVTIFSGGTEGVLSPHVTFFVRAKNEPTGLVTSIVRTRVLAPHEVGTSTHARQVSVQVAQAMRQASLLPEHVHLVLIKCPLLTSGKIEAIRAESRTPITTDTYESMAKSRYASALGIALALEELPDAQLDEALLSESTWSAKASCSSGAELEDCHILILATDPKITKPGSTGALLHAVSRPMTDAIDAAALLHLLDQVKKDNGKVVQVFAKAEADPRGLVRTRWRHTMNTDSDIHSTRHARAAVGGLIAGLVQDCEVYVSGGAEGQGPAGGGSLCVVYKTDKEGT